MTTLTYSLLVNILISTASILHFKNSSWCTVFESSLACNGVMVLPASENKYSFATDVAGMVRNLHAKEHRLFNFGSSDWTCHHSNRLGLWLLYLSWELVSVLDWDDSVLDRDRSPTQLTQFWTQLTQFWTETIRTVSVLDQDN